MDREAKALYMKEYLKKYRLQNRQKILEQMSQYKREYTVENRDEIHASYARYYRENKQARLEYQRGYREKSQTKYKARELVASAIRRGSLVRQNCHCGEVGEAHHEDYNQPLKVKWLCPKHHMEIHRKYA